jgi:hypothetical protein
MASFAILYRFATATTTILDVVEDIRLVQCPSADRADIALSDEYASLDLFGPARAIISFRNFFVTKKDDNIN